MDFDLKLSVPFAISRSTTETRPVCIARVEHEAVTGYGEASPSPYYGDTPAKAEAAITGSVRLLAQTAPDHSDAPGDRDPIRGPVSSWIETIAREMRARFPESPSGRAAVEMALWDMAGKRARKPVHELLGLPAGPLPLTSFTVGVTDAGVARGMLDALRGFPILKAKVGFGDEEALLDLLAGETGAVLRVDANEGWSLEEAVRKINLYRDRYSIELFEQPLPRQDIEGYRKLRRETDAVIVVDESVIEAEDVAPWSGIVDGVNIKLMKCGGLLHALRIASEARGHGMKIMLGCMVESSLAISAAAQIASVADYCDLDGNLLISNDPFQGVKAPDGVLALPGSPGLGASPAAGL